MPPILSIVIASTFTVSLIWVWRRFRPGRSPALRLNLGPDHGLNFDQVAIAWLEQVARWLPGRGYYAYWLTQDQAAYRLRASICAPTDAHPTPSYTGLMNAELPTTPLTLPTSARPVAPALSVTGGERWLVIPFGHELLVRVLLHRGQRPSIPLLHRLADAGRLYTPLAQAIAQNFRVQTARQHRGPAAYAACALAPGHRCGPEGSAVTAEAGLTAAKGLQEIRSWALYYGFGQVPALSGYDLAVLAPGGHTPADLQRLAHQHVRTLAYMSVLEVPRQKGQPPPGNVLKVNGEPVAIETFDNWVLDPRHPATEARVMHLAASLHAFGYDGLFLDAIDDVEDLRIPKTLGDELIPAAAWLVANLHQTFDRLLLVQNWGLTKLLPFTMPYLDGVCWESFPWQNIGPMPGLHALVRTLARAKEQYGLQVLALNADLPGRAEYQHASDVAARCGFLWYGTSKYTEMAKPWRQAGVDYA